MMKHYKVYSRVPGGSMICIGRGYSDTLTSGGHVIHVNLDALPLTGELLIRDTVFEEQLFAANKKDEAE